jgi:hypothetical protein
VFIAPLQQSLRSLDPLYSTPPLHRFYIIANTKLVPEWKPAEASLLSIAQSSIAAVNKSHSAGDLFRLYLLARRDGADFNLAAIPASFSQEAKKPFDRQYMRALFDAGVAQAGARWLREPPSLAGHSHRQVDGCLSLNSLSSIIVPTALSRPAREVAVVCVHAGPAAVAGSQIVCDQQRLWWDSCSNCPQQTAKH